MTTPTHRVLRALPAGDITYHPGDLVDAADWANVRSLISTDYLEALSREEITILESNASAPPTDDTGKTVISPSPHKATPAKKSLAKKAAAKKAAGGVKAVPRPVLPGGDL